MTEHINSDNGPTSDVRIIHVTGDCHTATQTDSDSISRVISQHEYRRQDSDGRQSSIYVCRYTDR